MFWNLAMTSTAKLTLYYPLSNQSVLTFNNTSISMNMVEAARRAKSSHYFYASSACVYNEAKQEDPENPGLVEADAWPARPQDMYGLEKLYSEEMTLAYGKDFGIEVSESVSQ